ncbi:MAG: cyclic pyranopterin monophosphate synthase MoaC [Candidatus Kapabacteria bacterium]|nr:cyclic pyranopterin monophosphate synthase MoaC [Candidatus Kapabacteria bacterium]
MLSHTSVDGKPKMVNIGEKPVTQRFARARAIVALSEDIVRMLEEQGEQELLTAKGAVFQTAILAGIMAAKATDELIPLCHRLPLEHCHIAIALHKRTELHIECTVSTTAKTGVEMEALVGASIAALTVYDMCKSLSHNIIIREIMLLEKYGGKSDVQQDQALD